MIKRLLKCVREYRKDTILTPTFVSLEVVIDVIIPLLMAGLMLADKTAAIEDENRQLKLKLAEIEARPQPEREKIEVAVVPPGLRETLAEIAARAEAMAASVEDRLS